MPKVTNWTKRHKNWVLLIVTIVALVVVAIGVRTFYVKTTFVAPQTSLARQSNSKLKHTLQKQPTKPVAQKYLTNNHSGITNQGFSQLFANRKIAVRAGLQNAQVSYVKVPSVNIALPIYNATNPYTLSLGAAKYFANDQMGHGNYVLAGHNMLTPGILFSNLPSTPIGSSIYLISAHHTYHYRVFKNQAVDPNQPYTTNGLPANSSVLYQSPKKPIVTLFCCDASGSQRIVVQGRLV